jgi:hypothetical protein
MRAAITLILFLAAVLGWSIPDPPPPAAGVFPGEVPRDVSDDPRPPAKVPVYHTLPR